VAVVAGGLLAGVVLGGCAPRGADRGADTPPPAGGPSPAVSSSAAPLPPAPVDLTVELVAKKLPRMGSVVTDEGGWVLYRFDTDGPNPSKSSCVDQCAQVWPPALTDGNPKLRGISPDKVGTVLRPDGTKQLTIGGWLLYRYIGDLEPGDWKGQAVNGTWFVITKDGKKNLACLPSGTPTPVAPPNNAANTSPSPADGGY
jgi:predicted lipoprotein with Yx(FWY)xxD motif